MTKNISIIGGDLRIVKLAEMLAKDNFQIKTYALENSEDLKKIENLRNCTSIEETIKQSNIVIGPIPLSKDNIEINTPFSKEVISIKNLGKYLKGKKFFTGNIKEEFLEYFESEEVEVIDLLKREELVILNTIATAEGTIQIAMEQTSRTLHGSNILILGFGRVAKTLANMLKAIGANVYCMARKNSDFAWMKTYGYKQIKLEDLKNELSKFDIIINTIPTLILGKEEIDYIKKESLLIDLASAPGGIALEEAKNANIKVNWALGLPGKVAPLTSAEIIKDTIYNVLNET